MEATFEVLEVGQTPPHVYMFVLCDVIVGGMLGTGDIVNVSDTTSV
jgi:hypothetical protein